MIMPPKDRLRNFFFKKLRESEGETVLNWKPHQGKMLEECWCDLRLNEALGRNLAEHLMA